MTETIKLVIATPLYGNAESASVSFQYHQSVMSMVKDPDCDFISGWLLSSCDLVRARSRAVRMFLERPADKATHLLFWDADVVPRDLRAIRHMAHTGLDVLGMTYPHKRIRFDTIEPAIRDEAEQASMGRQTAEQIEQLGMVYPMRAESTGPIAITPDQTAEIDGLPAGFLMIRRHTLESMVERYRGELEFDDEVDGKLVPTVAIFQLLIRGRKLLNEDYSFCYRWRDMGGKVHLLMDPASHVGSHVFRGHISGLVKQ